MTTFDVAYNATTKVVKVQKDGTAPGAGFTDIGTFDHSNNDPDDKLGKDNTHVLYHHIRDLLYKQGVEDMSSVTIQYKYVDDISVAPPTVSKAAGQTQQITTTFTPADAANQELTFASSDVTKATVNATGLISFVAAGTATITVTSKDTGKTATVVVTVT